jgi:glycine dehydrogenase subunit 1
MPYAPHTEDDRQRMLAALGLESVDELFAGIPPSVRAGGLDLPEGLSEVELAAELSALAGRNRVDLASFLGAGVYRHYIPAAVDQLISRGEFYTAYTPYQPEISQGTLQTIYEYQSLLAALTGLEVVSASHYDGASATAEAALMTVRATQRGRLLVSRAVHPHYRETLRTYLHPRGLVVEEVPIVAGGPASGTTDLAALEAALASTALGPTGNGTGSSDVAGVILAQPNFYGVLEPMEAAARFAHTAGALFVAAVEPISLAVLQAPGEYGADIATGDGQPLGVAPQFGGPYLGILAATEPLTRQVPGRLIGKTRDLDGKRAYVMTLRAREQDIRRERAASNICTNQALVALVATVYLSLLGPHGLRDVAALGASRARELESALAGAGAPRLHEAPYLNEFAVRVPDARGVHARLLDVGVLGGLALATIEPDRADVADALLVCATEITTPAEIERFATALRGELGGGVAPRAADELAVAAGERA